MQHNKKDEAGFIGGILHAVRTIRKLNHVDRCARFPLVNPTTVAEHSFHVAVLALFIAEEAVLTQPSLSVEKVMRRALLHDVEESLISDIPHDVKRHIPSGVIDKALESMVDAELHSAPAWFLGAVLTPCDSSTEHQIAKLADHLELVLYCIEEWQLGNRNLKHMLGKAVQLSGALNSAIQSQTAHHIIEEGIRCQQSH